MALLTSRVSIVSLVLKLVVLSGCKIPEVAVTFVLTLVLLSRFMVGGVADI
jgi:hypothetical protein